MKPLICVVILETLFIVFVCLIPIGKTANLLIRVWLAKKAADDFQKLVERDPAEALAQVKKKYGI